VPEPDAPPTTRRERAALERAQARTTLPGLPRRSGARSGRPSSAPAARTVSRPVRLAVQGVVLALVAGGTSAFAVLHKAVTVDVDGAPVEVSAFGRTVGDVLAGADIEVGEGDLVAPGLDEHITSGSQVVVRHGREIEVEVDGAQKTVWTTALTVGEAVEGLGLRGGDTLLSASRSASLGRDLLRVSTEKTLHLAVDGQVIDGVSSASTVREALREIGLVLEEGDHVSVPLDATAVDGLVVLVTRASQGDQTVTEVVPFETIEEEDPELVQGKKVVATKGRAGQRQTTYATSLVGGAVVERTVLASAVTVAPVNQVVRVGTAALPDPSTVAVEPGTAQALGKEMAAARGYGDDQFACLLALWKKESGWRVNAENTSSGAYGIPQSLPGSKMATVADDWRTNPATQITWGLNYIEGRYGDPCGAWAHSQAKGWY
jgi:uncharacterized protein YabE (DUF348 family)